jgi:general secretion pathway protein N
MRATPFAALGIAAYAGFLIATIPATLVATRVGPASGIDLMLSDASGTLWSGRASARIGTSTGYVGLDSLRWTFLPLRLAAGQVAFELRASGPGIEGHASVARGISRWEVSDARGEAQAPLAIAIVPWIATWRPEGSLAINASSVSWDDGGVRGDATVEWRRAAVALSEVRPLGSYRVTAHAEGGPMQLSLTTIEGPLRVTGRGSLTPPQRVAFTGEAHGEGDSAKALAPLLDLIGPPRPDGARAIEMRR